MKLSGYLFFGWNQPVTTLLFTLKVSLPLLFLSPFGTKAFHHLLLMGCFMLRLANLQGRTADFISQLDRLHIIFILPYSDINNILLYY